MLREPAGPRATAVKQFQRIQSVQLGSAGPRVRENRSHDLQLFRCSRNVSFFLRASWNGGAAKRAFVGLLWTFSISIGWLRLLLTLYPHFTSMHYTLLRTLTARLWSRNVLMF